MEIGSSSKRSYLIENLATLVEAGINISESLSIISSGIKNNHFKKIVLNIKENVDSGFSLWQSFEKANIFSKRDISLIMIGENSGHLVENLNILALQHQKEKFFRYKVYSALMYPSLVLFLVLIIGTGMAWFLLPKLSVVFTQLGAELPLITKIMISVGVFFGNYGLIFFPIFFVLLFLFFYFVFVNKKTKVIGQKFLFNFFSTRRLVLESELSRFGYILGTLLQAGFSINESLKLLNQASPFPFYGDFYLYLSESVSEGISLKESFANFSKSDKLIPGSVQEMIFVGERSGKLPEILLKIGKNYEDKLEITTRNLSAILEPVLLILVWVGVVTLALAIILPVYSLISNIN